MVEELDKFAFQQKVIDTSGKVLVEFFATWCPHCQKEAPVVDKVASELEGVVPVYRVDIDKCPELAQTYAADGVPAFALFEGGQMVARKMGEQPREELLSLVDGQSL